MIEKWRKMSVGDRRRIQIMIIFGLVAVYAPFYLKSSGKLFEAKRMLHRREDRIEKRASLEGLGGGGPNVRFVETRIDEVEEQLKQVTVAYDKLSAGFVPLDSNQAQQDLMLEISTLAERTGVQLLSVSKKGSLPQGGAEAKVPVDAVVGRPIINVTAKAGFGPLFSFLRQLDRLSHHVSVMNLKLYFRDPKNERATQNENADGTLYVQLQMSL